MEVEEFLEKLDEGVDCVCRMGDKFVEEITNLYDAKKQEAEEEDSYKDGNRAIIPFMGGSEEEMIDNAGDEIDCLTKVFEDKIDAMLEGASSKVDELLEGAEGGTDKSADAGDITDTVSKALDVFSGAVTSCMDEIDGFIKQSMDIARKAVEADFPSHKEKGKEIADTCRDRLKNISSAMRGVFGEGLGIIASLTEEFEDALKEDAMEE